jgi:hypothetical protein
MSGLVIVILAHPKPVEMTMIDAYSKPLAQQQQ